MLCRCVVGVAVLVAAGGVEAAAVKRQTGYVQSSTTASSSTSSLPDYYQTYPEFYPGMRRVDSLASKITTDIGILAGPTPTGAAAFLAETNPAPFPGVTYVAPAPLETQVPIVGQQASDESIYHFHGQLSQ